MTVPAGLTTQDTPTVAPTAGGQTGTLQKIRGVDYPDSAADPKLKAAYIEKRFHEGDTDALARYQQATYNILYANGRHWISWKRSKQRYEDLPLPEGDFRVTINYVIVLLRARIQRLVSSEINWRAIPRDNSYHERDKANVAVNLLKARFAAQEMEQKVRAGLMQASMTGVCALKSFWNPAIGPLTPATMFFPEPVTDELGQVVGMQQVEHFVDAQGNPVQTEAEAFNYRPGDSDTALRTIFNLRLNPEATGWTQAEGLRWLVDSDIVPLDVAKERFQQLADEIRPMAGTETALTYERMIKGSATQQAFQQFAGSPYAGTSAQSPNLAQLTVIREYWEMPSTFFPKGRLMVSVGGAIAYDGPWPQGVFPYAPLFGEPAEMNPYGRPPVNDMRSPQDVINREYTAIAKEMWASGTGKFVAWAVPGVPDQISRSDDEVIQIPLRSGLAGRPIRDVFQRLDPAQVSPDRWRLIQESKATLFDIGAYHEVSRGQIPPGLDSGVAIQYLLEQESAQLKSAVEALKRALILWGRHQLAICRWGYGPEPTRWIPVNRPDLAISIESVNGVDLPDPETLGLDIEYFRPQSEAATRAEVKDLLGMGTIDPRTALKIMDLGGGFENAFQSQSRHYTKAMQENLAIQTQQFLVVPQITGVGPDGSPIMEPALMHPDGSPFFLPLDDDHEIHIDVHNEIALDTTQPWPVRQAMLQHIASHRTTMQRLMMGMAQAQAMSAAGGAVGQVPQMPPGNPYTPPPPPPAAIGGGHETLRRPSRAFADSQ